MRAGKLWIVEKSEDGGNTWAILHVCRDMDKEDAEHRVAQLTEIERQFRAEYRRRKTEYRAVLYRRVIAP